MARKIVTATTKPTNPAATTATNAPGALPVASKASWANMVAWFATNPAMGNSQQRKRAPHVGTVAGMVLATLQAGPATLPMLAAAIAHSPSTGGAHGLAILQRLHCLWGYTLAYNPATQCVSLVASPSY